MRSERDAILATICDEIDNDTPRLVFADWLEENGDHQRAEFIRAQIRLARWTQKPGVDRDRLELVWRSRELLAIHGDRWRQEISPIIREVNYERGFPILIACWAFEFLQVARDLFEAAPFRRLRLTAGPAREREAQWENLLVFPVSIHAVMAAINQIPSAARLSELDLLGCGIVTHLDAEALIRSPTLGKLRELRLRVFVEDMDAVGEHLRRHFGDALQIVQDPEDIPF